MLGSSDAEAVSLADPLWISGVGFGLWGQPKG